MDSSLSPLLEMILNAWLDFARQSSPGCSYSCCCCAFLLPHFVLHFKCLIIRWIQHCMNSQLVCHWPFEFYPPYKGCCWPSSVRSAVFCVASHSVIHSYSFQRLYEFHFLDCMTKTMICSLFWRCTCNPPTEYLTSLMQSSTGQSFGWRSLAMISQTQIHPPTPTHALTHTHPPTRTHKDLVWW